jgi:hypothetical protein
MKAASVSKRLGDRYDVTKVNLKSDVSSSQRDSHGRMSACPTVRLSDTRTTRFSRARVRMSDCPRLDMSLEIIHGGL